MQSFSVYSLPLNGSAKIRCSPRARIIFSKACDNARGALYSAKGRVFDVDSLCTFAMAINRV